MTKYLYAFMFLVLPCYGLDIREAQQFQREFDEKHFQLNHGFEKIRHILLHLAISTGKMASYCETKEHGKEPDPQQLLDEVLPDLLIHALQIANHYDVDLGAKYEERIQFILNRSKANP
jgi:hypothetical protein